MHCAVFMHIETLNKMPLQQQLMISPMTEPTSRGKPVNILGSRYIHGLTDWPIDNLT